MPIYYLFLALFLSFLPVAAASQTKTDSTTFFFIKVDSITIEGNKITRKPLILRELEFHRGDSIPVTKLEETLERNRKRVVNLRIFNDVTFTVHQGNTPDHITLHIKVREAWYWFPAPVFELVDRNFNVWFNEFNHSLKRTNYGGDYTQYNFTGHADVLNLTATSGYNNRFSARYRTPTINKKQTIGIQAGITYQRTREVAVNTLNNKLVFFSNPNEYAIQRLTTELSMSWRPGLLHAHRILLEHRRTTIADTIARVINPRFFDPGITSQEHNSLVYTYTFDDRDIRAYTTKGWNILVELRQNGLLPSDDLHLFRSRVEVSKFTSFKPWLSLETAARVRATWPRSRPPYFNNQSLGYGSDLVRGYEYFVMDGLDLGVVKTSIRARVFNQRIPYPKLVTKYCKRCQPVGTQLFVSIQNDFGYSYDPWYTSNNPLTNRVLYATGIGLDLVLFNRIAMQVAWMYTVTGQNGFFVRTRL